MFGLFESDPNKLLRKATAQKESGDIEGAVATLRQADKAIGKGQTVYPVETFLRLPAYLQEAGHRDEAWQAYETLLAGGYSLQSNRPDLIPMYHSAIYDKMRLFLQREGSPIPAVAYGVLSHCSWAIGLYRQNRKAELQSHVMKSAIDKLTKHLLKQANRLDVQEQLSQYIFEKLRDIQGVGLDEVFSAVNSIFSQRSS
jgi:hypothetical protein